jgi:hypothetical protein
VKFFRETQPGIFVSSGALRTEQDGEEWTRDYDVLLARGRPFAVIANVNDRPDPSAGKPMVLWMKVRRKELAALVKLTVYVVEDAAARANLEVDLPRRSKSSPYPMAVAATEAEAIAKAQANLT